MALTVPAFAAITLDDRGGGVATAARLMWQAVQDGWGSHSRLVVLERAGMERATRLAQTAERVEFGLRMSAAQVLSRCEWMLYSHLSLARVHAFVPAPLRRPYAIFLHGIEVWRPLSPRQRRTIEGASLLLCNSSYTAQRVRTAHPWIGPIMPCPLALPADVADASPGGSGRTGVRGRTVLTVARMSSEERYKGHDQLLEAWPLVIERVPDARLVLVGGGDDVDRLRTKSAALGVSRHVEFAGFVSRARLATLYSEARVFAMPSREEGFGLVYLEAMRHRLPCLGSVHDAAADVIVDGETGFLVDQSDRVSIADRIATLLLNDDLCARMGAGGYQRGLDQFSYEAFSTRFLLALRGAFEPAAEPRIATG